MRELILIAAILVCPLMMMLMMRHGHGHGHEAPDEAKVSTSELHRRRDELDRVISEREETALEERTPTGASL